MCDNMRLVPTGTVSDEAIRAALASLAKGMESGTAPADLPAAPPDARTLLAIVAVPPSSEEPTLVAVVAPTSTSVPTVTPAAVVIPTPVPVVAPVASIVPATIHATVSTSPSTVHQESLEDVLLAAFDCATEEARRAVMVRLTYVLSLPNNVNPFVTRSRIASLVASATLKPRDIPDWLDHKKDLGRVSPKVVEALETLHICTIDSLTLQAVNALYAALRLPSVAETEDWCNQVCGQKLVGKVYEKLTEQGYKGDMPAVFTTGLNKYLVQKKRR